MSTSARKPSKKRLDSARAALARLCRSDVSEEPPVLHLKDLVRKSRSPGAELAWLAAHDSDREVHMAAVAMLSLAAREPAVPGEVKDRIGRSATPVLVRAMRDSSVSDERKYCVGPLLDLFGAGLSNDEYRACFRDFDGADREMKRKLRRVMPQDMQSIENVLVEAGLIRHERPAAPSEEDVAAAFAVGAALCEASPEVGAAAMTTTAAIAWEHGRAAEVRGRVLEYVASIENGRAAWFLGELGRLPAAGSLGEKARELSGDLERAGIAPAPPATGAFSHGLVGGIDGSGCRSLMLFYRTGTGDLDALALLLNDVIGVKDVWCVFGNAADLDEEVRGRSRAVSYAACPLEIARAVVADAMAIHEETGRPFPGRFLLHRHYLGAEPFSPSRRTPNLGAYMLETFVRGPELVEGSERAFEDPIYGGLWCGSDEAYEFVRRFTPRRGRGKIMSDMLSTSGRLFKRFVSEIASKERETLARRIAVNLEVEALAGRASNPGNRAAARTWIALAENVVPFEDIPYVRLLCTQSIKAVLANLRQGYKGQAEANRARLKMDEEAARLASGLFGEGW